MSFSVTITSNSLSELRAMFAKIEGQSDITPEASPIKKSPVEKSVAVEKDESEAPEKPKSKKLFEKAKAEVAEENVKAAASTLTYNDVKKATVSLASKDTDKVKAILAEYGISSATALKEEQWEGYVKKINTALSEVEKDLA